MKLIITFAIALLTSLNVFAQNQWYKKLVLTPEVGIGRDFETRSGQYYASLDLFMRGKPSFIRIQAPFIYGLRLGWQFNEFFVLELGFNRITRSMKYYSNSTEGCYDCRTQSGIHQSYIPLGIKFQNVFNGKLGIEFGFGGALAFHDGANRYYATSESPGASVITINEYEDRLIFVNKNLEGFIISLYASIGATYYFTKNVGLQLSIRYINELLNDNYLVLQEYDRPSASKLIRYRAYDIQFHSLYLNLGLTFRL